MVLILYQNDKNNIIKERRTWQGHDLNDDKPMDGNQWGEQGPTVMQ